MIYSKSIFSLFIGCLLFCNCSDSSSSQIVYSKQESRPIFFQKFLDDNFIEIGKYDNIFIIKPYSCGSGAGICGDYFLPIITDSVEDESNLYILDASEPILESKLIDFGEVFIDKPFSLNKYGLDNVYNQLFKISKGKLIFSSLINDETIPNIKH